MTYPQIVMLNHAAYVNYENSKDAAKNEDKKEKRHEEKDPVVWHGKRLSEMRSEELAVYYNEL